MEEIYWITRLDSVVDWLGIFQVSGLIFGFLLLIAGTIWKYISLYSVCDGDANSKYYKNHSIGFGRFRWVGTILVIVGFVSGIAKSFVPTTKEACAIYVGGSVVDYVQGNDTIKALPDKMVNFANEYLNQLIEKNKTINNNNYNGQ